MAGGAIVDRFESHDLLDVVTSSMDVCEPLHYFHNNGDGTFAEQTKQAGLADQLGGLNLIQADYNNDGCMDILVLRGGWEFPMRKSLLRNNCNGTFTDVTRESGLGRPSAARRPPSGPTSTTTAVSICSSATRRVRASSFATRATAPSRTSRSRRASTGPDSSRPWSPPTTTTTATWTSICPTTTATTSSITTIATGRSPRSASRRACRRRGAASPPGSSTTTTTAGPICS